MRLDKAIRAAKIAAKHRGEIIYVVIDFDEYDITDEFGLETDLLHAPVLFAVESDGTVDGR